jgi:hypothetical protein
MMAALKPNMLGIIMEKRREGHFKTENVVSFLWALWLSEEQKSVYKADCYARYSSNR